jgi:hypothetical protein
MAEELTPSQQYRQVWDAVDGAKRSTVVAEVTEPYVYGSLRPEVTELRGRLGESIVRVTNLQVAFAAEDEAVRADIERLESLAYSEAVA